MFAGNLVRTIHLKDGSLKVNTENERRIYLQFTMPLTDENMRGADQSIKAAYNMIEMRDQAIVEGSIDKEFLMTLEFYELPEHTSPRLALTAVTLRKLIVSRPTTETGKTNISALLFETNVPSAGLPLWDWVFEKKGHDVYVRFHVAQKPLIEEPPEKGPVQGKLGEGCPFPGCKKLAEHGGDHGEEDGKPGKKKKSGKEAAAGE